MAIPDTGILDSFDRANEEPVTGWTDMAGKGGAKIVSNVMTGDSAAYCGAYWNQVFTVPCEWYLTITDAIGAADTIEPVYMLTDGGAASPIRDSNKTGYVFLTNFPADNRVAVRRYDNGAFAAAMGDWAWATENGDSFLFRVEAGGAHSVYGKASAGAWTLIGTFVDNTYTSGTFAWGSTATGTGAANNFGGGALGQVVLPDADVTTTGWTTAPLFSKVNDSSDATVVTATAA